MNVIVASFGFITPIKRIDVLARAFRAVRSRCPELRLVLIGEASPAVDVESFFEPEDLASGRVLHRGYVSAETMATGWPPPTSP